MRQKNLLLFFSIVLMLGVACTKEAVTPKPITILSITVNGSDLTDGAANVPLTASIAIVFSAGLDTDLFESALSITSGGVNLAGDITYSNQTSRVTIDLDLAYQTTYTLTIDQRPIGRNGESLESQRSFSFTSIADGTIYRQAPCTTGTGECLRTMVLEGNPAADFDFYSSFPIYEANAEWLDLTTAVIVVHGANRNADDYFEYLMGTLQTTGVANEVVLIAPFFKQGEEASESDLYWSDNGWREGRQSAGDAKVSSLELVDRLIGQLSDRQHFPALRQVIVTGHSSGALFTHLYAAAGKASIEHPDLDLEYVVANSQYFYYPDGQRIDEGSDQLYTPSNCNGYDFWPLGFRITPPYLNGVEPSSFNEQFVNSSITYLLGNGSGPDGTLNTTDCAATILGSSRYRRGENMFRYMELRFPGQHRHQRVIVADIGHDGARMYRSPEFATLLAALLGE